MTVHLDPSVLVDALTGARRSWPPLERVVGAGHVIGASALILYEWSAANRVLPGGVP
jgi:hypothetical protein